MSAAPFDVALVAERIRTGVPQLRQVGRAADYAAMTKLGDFPVPCCYVLLAREKPTETRSGISQAGKQTKLAQITPATFGVVLAVRNYREQAGAQLADELGEILGAIRNLLGGWTPPVNGARACQLIQGDLTQYDRATALWTDVWRTQHILSYGATTP